MLRSNKKTIFETLGRHPIHPFPARMAPGIALDALSESKSPLRVLDPMAGSGTVLAVARSKGHRGFGVDSDPLAVLLARVWTKTTDRKLVAEQANETLCRAKERFARTTIAKAYPPTTDDETREFVRYWFDDRARRQLASLAAEIQNVPDGTIRDVLWCGFSRLIIAKQAGASLALDLAHSRPHKAFSSAPIEPLDKFIDAVEMVSNNCPDAKVGRVGPPCVVQRGDARNLNITDGSIDLVLTSPPYLNAIDYLRCSKFSLIWMGFTIGELRKIRSESVGTERSSEEALAHPVVKDVLQGLKLRPRLSPRHHAMLSRYVLDMNLAVREATRVLRLGGRAVYVVGDSTIRGTYVRNSAIVASVAAACGLAHAGRHTRILPANRRYMPPPRQRSAEQAQMDARMRREVVLTFEKTIDP